ncbi:MAG: hypothetical protein JO161_05625, partial [Planctomycetaceae bacterium]|nr:hypothetical protein [Planctomycetaceae bacterium]
MGRASAHHFASGPTNFPSRRTGGGGDPIGTFERISFEELTRQGLPHQEALDLLNGLDSASRIADAPGRWAYLSRHVLRPHHPASLHES